MQVREKVEKSRNTVFFQCLVSPEGRKVGSLKRRVRSHLGRWEIKNCTPLWGKAHLEAKGKNTSCSELVWKFRCRKSARRCGAKHFEVKVWKADHVPTTVGRSTARHETRRHDNNNNSNNNNKNKKVNKVISNNNSNNNNSYSYCYNHSYNYTKLHYTYATLHKTTLHCTTLQCTTLHYTMIRHTTLHNKTTQYNYNYHYNYNCNPLHHATSSSCGWGDHCNQSKKTTPTTFRSFSGFALPSMHHNNSPLL